ncbi:hypothetical protein [Erythrobacter sp. THAF29]|uniref:hypothetical protein n=1 Tax=Erythrobacter sp. THAF29 TaxID=2587851 RepID=UPI0012689731|nr:hypothetical protein [Erythrobacter sp. THAF29]QFT78604.1 hypothetical protein FIU90_13730 [Erythrobacter sp. THAF29]
MKNFQRTLVLGASIVALAGCGADEIVSPGTSGDIIINNPAPSPTPSPTPTGGATVTPAAGCPTINSAGGLTDAGTISGPTGEYRVCTLPETFNVDDNLPFVNGLLYQISGRVNVGTDQGFNSTGTDVTLNVEPGVIFFAQAESFFVVNRGNTIEANGTPTMPIIWTSRDNVLGLSNDNSQAQWGGVVLLGRAPVSDCSNLVFNTAAAPNANPQCEQQLEGTVVATPFGGTDSADSSGSMTYNQIRYSGFELQQSNELQSLTTGGTGSGTTLENIMSFNSSDDGVEFFGGSVNVKNLAVIGASDDSLDVDSGAQANVETVVVVQRTGTGDSLIEFDSPDDLADGTPGNALPQSTLQVNNFTFVQRSSSSSQAIRARGGPALSLTNGIIDVDTADDVCIRIDEQITLNAIIGFDSVVCDGVNRPVRGSSGVSDAEVQAVVDAGTNNNLMFTLSLTNTFVNGANENGVTPFDATARSSFFSASTFIGAEDDNVADVFGDWTCNSSIMDFGSATGACTSLPVY